MVKLICHGPQARAGTMMEDAVEEHGHVLLLARLRCAGCLVHRHIRSPCSLPRAAGASLKASWVALGAVGWGMRAAEAEQPILHRSGQP